MSLFYTRIAPPSKLLVDAMKKYGIRITLTEDNPMRAEHLLGDDWEAYRWYDDPDSRDRAMEAMRARLPNYRLGDAPSQIVEPVER